MNDLKHTPAPWPHFSDNESNSLEVSAEHNMLFHFVESNSAQQASLVDMRLVDYNRARLCVQACEGLDNVGLIALGAGLDVVRRDWATKRALKGSRDLAALQAGAVGLLEALAALLSCEPPAGTELNGAIRTMIAILDKNGLHGSLPSQTRLALSKYLEI